jgi:hypothetical protein
MERRKSESQEDNDERPPNDTGRELGFPITGVIHRDLRPHDSELELLHAGHCCSVRSARSMKDGNVGIVPFFNRTSLQHTNVSSDETKDVFNKIREPTDQASREPR